MPLTNPIISRVAPVQVGGSANAGLGFLASAFDHAHPLIETSGPSNLNMGGILAGEAVRRVAGDLVGRQLQVARLTTGGGVTTSSTTFSDVSSQLNFDLKASTDYLVFWVVYYETAAVATPIRLSTNYTGTVTSGTRFGLFGATSGAGVMSGAAFANDTTLWNGSAGPGPTEIVMALVSGFFRTINAGNLALRYRTGATSSSVTVHNGTHGFLIQM